MTSLAKHPTLAVLIIIISLLFYTELSKAWLTGRRFAVHSSSPQTTIATKSSLSKLVAVTLDNFTETSPPSRLATIRPDLEHTSSRSSWLDNLPWLAKPRTTIPNNEAEENESTVTYSAPELQVTSTANALQNFTTLNLTDPLMKACLFSRGKVYVTAKKGIIILVYNPGGFIYNRNSLSCEIEVTVSQNRVVVLETKFRREVCGFTAQFLIMDTSTRKTLSRSRCGMYVPKTFGISNSLTIYLKLPLVVMNKEHRVVFSFTELANIDKPGIELHYMTATSGEKLQAYS